MIPPAVIFDCDGTLVDSELIHATALQGVLAEFGVKLTAEQIRSRSASVANDEFLVRIAYERAASFPADAEFRVEEIALGLIESMLKPIPGAEQVVRRLAADGIRLAVASNSSRRLVDRMLRSIGLASIFDGCIVTRDDVNAPKPDPDIYRRAAVLLNVKPEDCTAVEDSPVGIHAAYSAGVKVIGYRHWSSIFQREQLMSAGASAVVTDLRELLSCLRDEVAARGQASGRC